MLVKRPLLWLLLEPCSDGAGALHLVDQLDPDLGVSFRRQGSLGFPEYAPAGWGRERKSIHKGCAPFSVIL